MLKRRLTKDMKAAIRAYYAGRRRQGKVKWDKQACLRRIDRSRPRWCTGFESCAGTFWFYWSDGIVTIHSEQNWWTCKRWTRG